MAHRQGLRLEIQVRLGRRRLAWKSYRPFAAAVRRCHLVPMAHRGEA